MDSLPLSDTLVIEVGERIGAGVCGALLAQLGAQTVFVEVPGRLQHMRRQLGAGKLCLHITPKLDEDGDLLHRLFVRADVILASSDVDSEVLNVAEFVQMNGKVVCDLTAYGKTGPCAGRADSEWQIQAVSGIIDTTGMVDGPPVPIVLPIVEYMTGLYATSATLAALRVRRECGLGQSIDMALYDCAVAAMATFLPPVLTGSKQPVERAGNCHALISPWNTYQAQDGWILICVGSDAQWHRLCEVMGREELKLDTTLACMTGRIAARGKVDDIVQTWVNQYRVEECERLLNQASIASGAVVGVSPRPLEPNLDHRGMIRQLIDPETGHKVYVPGSPLRMSETPGRASEWFANAESDRETVHHIAASSPRAFSPPAGQLKSPLCGVRVIEIGHYTTVPLSTRHMGALGAEVIKIEPPAGEATRGWRPAQRGQSYFFTYMNTDKRSLVLDLSQEKDAQVLRELIASSDVLIENLKPGALARRGFSPERLAEINPRLISCGVSGFGSDSIYAGRPAYDSVIQAMSGIMDVVRADGEPVKTGISIADILGAVTALVAVLAALEYRDKTGKGQHLDLSMQDVAAWMIQMAWNGRAGDIATLSVVKCSDGYVVVQDASSALSRTAEAVIERPDGALVSDIKRRQLCSRLASHGARAAPILKVHEMAAAPQTTARQLWFNAEAEGEIWPLMASPLRLSRTPAVVSRPMPALGADSEYIRATLGRRRHRSA